MAMTRKHYEAAAEEAGKVLSEIKGHDVMLLVILRADVAEAMVRVVEAAANANATQYAQTRLAFDRDRFEKAMWAAAAAHE